MDGSDFTDYADPFELLTALHQTRLRMIYENSFARGDQSYAGAPGSIGLHGIPGRSIRPRYKLPSNAPSTEWQARQGSGRVLPPTREINFNRDYGNPGIDRREWQRVGTAMQPIGAAVQNMAQVFYDRRQADKEAKQSAQGQPTQGVSPLLPLAQRYGDIQEEMSSTKNKIEDLKMNIKETKLGEKHKAQIAKEEAASKKSAPPPAPAVTTTEPISQTDKIRRNARGQYSRSENTQALELATSPAVGTPPEQQPVGEQPMAPQATQKTPARPKKVAMKAQPMVEAKPKGELTSSKPKRPTLKANPQQAAKEK